jgi:hypothetical protein
MPNEDKEVSRDRATRETNRCCHPPPTKTSQLFTLTIKPRTLTSRAKNSPHHETTIMPTPQPKGVAAKPSRAIFDPFNSSATGHQRAENRLGGSTSWRDSRALKLRAQFVSGAGGGERVSDTVGAGSLEFGRDGRTESGGWVEGAKGLRTGGQTSLWGAMKVEKKDVERSHGKEIKVEGGGEEDATVAATCVVNAFTPLKKAADGSYRETSWTSHEASPSHLLSPWDAEEAPSPVDDEDLIQAVENVEEATKSTGAELSSLPLSTPPSTSSTVYPQIFSNLTFYINGSTAPHISDHKLKHLLSLHGGNLSISLGRKSVTHVIIGKPGSAGEGCGGGLAGTKIQKEISRQRGKALHFVTAEWVVQSAKAGKRLAESRFEGMKLAPKGVGGIAGMFAKQAGVKRPG